MKIKQTALDKYARFLALGTGQPRRLMSAPNHVEGRSALECFHLHESTGRMLPTSEPDILDAYLSGKEIHGITVQMVAEDFVSGGLMTSAEIKCNYPTWVAREIFQQAKRHADKTLGYVPGFLENECDFSEASFPIL